MKRLLRGISLLLFLLVYGVESGAQVNWIAPVSEKYLDLAGNGNDVSGCYLREGYAFQVKGDFEEAVKSYEAALESGGDGSVLSGGICENLGDIVSGSLNYSMAVYYYEKALIRYRPLVSVEPLAMIRTCWKLGDLYSKKLEKDHADQYYLDALKIPFDEVTDDVKLCRINTLRGLCCIATDQFLSGIENFSTAMDNDSNGKCNDNQLIALINRGLGYCCLILHQVDSSYSCLRRALTLEQDFKSPFLPDIAGLYRMQGLVFIEKHEPVKAMHSFQEGLSVSEQSSCSDMILIRIDLLTARARLWRELGRQTNSAQTCLESAFNDYYAAIQEAEQYNLVPGSRESKMIFNETLQETCDEAMNTAEKLSEFQSPGLVQRAFEIAEAGRSRVLFSGICESDTHKHNPGFDSVSDYRKLAGDEYIAIQRKLAGKTDFFGTMPEKDQVASLDYLTGPGYWAGAFNCADPRLNRDNGSLSQPSSLFLAAMKNNLGPGEALLEYFLGKDALFIFCITSDSVSFVRRATEESFHWNIKKYGDLIKAADIQQFPEVSSALYKVLIAPVLGQLKNVRRLHLVPHLELSLIPFETLIMPGTSQKSDDDFTGFHYLIRDYEIIYHNSAAIWNYDRSGRVEKEIKKEFAGFAPGNFSETGDQATVSPLPATIDEIVGIKALLEKHGYKTTDYLADEATEIKVKEAAGNKSILHLATHCIVDEVTPGNSGLIFPEMKKKSGNEDGILHLDEILNLTVNADLVILSACSTGKGKISTAEGLLSLSRGFLFAGASSVVYSMWNIPDAFTRDLMVSFYTEFLTGKSYGAALREAKLQMIREPRSSLPLVWAGFVITSR